MVSKGKNKVGQNDPKPETVTKNVYKSCSNNNKGPIYEKRPKSSQEKLNTSLNQLKVGDKVLLDAADPRITTSETNEEIPLTVLSIFPYGTVEVNHPKFNTFKVNNNHLKPYVDKIYSRDEEYFLKTTRPSTLACIRLCENRARFFSPTRDMISCHGRATWLWAKLPKQHGRATRLCLETVVETENVTRAYDTPMPSTRGRHCQNKHGSGPMYMGVGETNEARHGRVRPYAQAIRA
ncbi:hypothetical protein GOBAR_AA29101 [Gossypium barbadense]|uniref:Uncharacterized protein n=1 Tax=Gossypium barbadense TaxID=3634 RepID=A0A2P5WKH4_GOSBA|nr:hypothetical protein GOBAR_AA29101 [Gossypium barbadense]